MHAPALDARRVAADVGAMEREVAAIAGRLEEHIAQNAHIMSDAAAAYAVADADCENLNCPSDEDAWMKMRPYSDRNKCTDCRKGWQYEHDQKIEADDKKWAKESAKQQRDWENKHEQQKKQNADIMKNYEFVKEHDRAKPQYFDGNLMRNM